MSKRILVVDDDPDIRQVLLDRLESYGYVVETAVDGRDALEALQRSPFDGMFLDIRMPDINGMEVLRETRKSHPGLPVVIVTSSMVGERAIEAIGEGAQAYLLKPFDAAQLKQILDRWIGPAT